MQTVDTSLVQKAKQGDSSAFGALYDKYILAIYRFIFLKVGGRQAEAEDITHQVFMSAWQKIGTYRDEGHPFSSWLYRIARNAVIDYYRTRKQKVSIETVPEELLSEKPKTSKNIDTAIDMEQVKICLAKLEPHYQDTLIMKYIDERSYGEIACALEKSEGAVRVIHHRALKKLKEEINHARRNN